MGGGWDLVPECGILPVALLATVSPRALYLALRQALFSPTRNVFNATLICDCHSSGGAGREMDVKELYKAGVTEGKNGTN